MTSKVRVEAIGIFIEAFFGKDQRICESLARSLIAADPLTAVAQEMREALRRAYNAMAAVKDHPDHKLALRLLEQEVAYSNRAIAAYDALASGKTQSAVDNAGSDRQTVDKPKEG